MVGVKVFAATTFCVELDNESCFSLLSQYDKPQDSWTPRTLFLQNPPEVSGFSFKKHQFEYTSVILMP